MAFPTASRSWMGAVGLSLRSRAKPDLSRRATPDLVKRWENHEEKTACEPRQSIRSKDSRFSTRQYPQSPPRFSSPASTDAPAGWPQSGSRPILTSARWRFRERGPRRPVSRPAACSRTPVSPSARAIDSESPRRERPFARFDQCLSGFGANRSQGALFRPSIASCRTPGRNLSLQEPTSETLWGYPIPDASTTKKGNRN